MRGLTNPFKLGYYGTPSFPGQAVLDHMADPMVVCRFCGCYIETNEQGRLLTHCRHCGAPSVLQRQPRTGRGVAIVTLVDRLTQEERKFIFEDGRVPAEALYCGDH